MSLKETYYPKVLARLHPKVSRSVSLQLMAMDAIFQSIMKTKGAAPNSRNARERKELREYLNGSYPAQLQEDIFNYAVGQWITITRLLAILETLEPSKLVTDRLEMLGSFRYAYGCYKTNQRLYWSNGTIERLNMNQAQCDQLYHYLMWSDTFAKKGLKIITFSTERGALNNSKLPSLLARSPNLTQVTILNGVTDHVMRILGLNCPHLKLLDVSHSSFVTNVGLKNLLMKNPRKSLGPDFDPATIEKNPCASTIFKMMIIGTGITYVGINLACRLMGDNSTHVCFLPEVMILRPWDGKAVCTSVTLDSPLALNALTPDEGVHKAINAVARWVDRKGGNENKIQALDLFVPQHTYKEAQHFVRTVGSPHSEAMLCTRKMTHQDGLYITQLTLCWDSFIWNVTSLPDITEMALALPTLEVLRARVKGYWERGAPMFPNLKETFIWSVCDSTILSFLAYCPKIETFKFNCLNLLPSRLLVTDESFQKTLLENPSLCSTLTEVCVRNVPTLSIETAKTVIEKCPNLLRLGDMESWNVSNEDLTELNRLLEAKNSPAVLTVLSFPPKEKHAYLI